MTPRATGLVVPVADLLPHPGARKPVEREALLGDLAVSGSRVPSGEPVRLDLELQAINDAIVAVGEVHAQWAGECRRCLKPITGAVVAHVQEIYERDPVEGETRKLDNNEVDLAEMARDVVLLELPLAPLCSDDCAGLCPTCGADRNITTCDCEQEAPDPRWAALADLKFDE